MNGFKVVMVVALVMALMGCATTEEQTGSRDFTNLCAAADINKDGSIDQEEFLAGAADKEKARQTFLQCDQDKNGLISQEEAERNKWLIQQEMMKRQSLRLLEPR